MSRALGTHLVDTVHRKTQGVVHALRTAQRRWVFLVGESGAVVLLLTGDASAPWRPCHAGVPMLHMSLEVWRVPNTPDVGNGTFAAHWRTGRLAHGGANRL